MGREVGGRVRMGNTCTPMADSCECMVKPPQYCRVISLQLKRKKSYDKPRQYIKKQRHHFANKGLYSQVVTYGCESWTMKKAKCQRINAFK